MRNPGEIREVTLSRRTILRTALAAGAAVGLAGCGRGDKKPAAQTDPTTPAQSPSAEASLSATQTPAEVSPAPRLSRTPEAVEGAYWQEMSLDARKDAELINGFRTEREPLEADRDVAAFDPGGDHPDTWTKGAILAVPVKQFVHEDTLGLAVARHGFDQDSPLINYTTIPDFKRALPKRVVTDADGQDQQCYLVGAKQGPYATEVSFFSGNPNDTTAMAAESTLVVGQHLPLDGERFKGIPLV